jgi:uncharacterized protein (DUF927 family)
MEPNLEQSQHDASPIIDQRAPGAAPPADVMADYARAYAANGWPLFPVHSITPQGICTCGSSNCAKPGKHPRIEAWTTKASCEAETVAQFWRDAPGANIGLLLGDVLVLDVEKKDNGLETFAEFERKFGALERRAQQVSGSGGYHFFFKASERLKATKTKAAPGIDLLTGAQYVILTPSRHISGGTYRWDAPPNLLMSRRDEIDLRPAPEWVLDLAEKKTPAPRRATGAATPSHSGERVPITRIMEGFLEKLRAGHATRNNSGIEFFIQVRDNQYSRAEASAVLRDWVKQANEAAPGDDRYTIKEAQDSLRSAYKRAPRDPWPNSKFTLKLSEPYNRDTDGVYADEKRICTPVQVVAVGRDGKHQGYRLVTLTDQYGEPQEVILSVNDFCEGAHIEKLMERGLWIFRDQALVERYLNESMPSEFFETTAETGWRPEGGPYLLPDASFGEAPDVRVIFRETSEHRYNVAGTFEDWALRVAAPCVGNSRLLLAVSAALAAPMLGLTGSGGLGIHLRGVTSCGKSTALKVAGSVWGGGGSTPEKGFLRSWNQTLNGLEGVASLHNHAALILDEIGEAKPAEISKASYMLINGAGRERMRANLTRREAATWSLVVLSSGEKGLSEVAAEAGQRMKGGQEIRLLDIPADCGAGFGLFEDIHGAPSSEAFADSLSRAATACYGVGVRRWLEWLAEHRAEALEGVKRLTAGFLTEHAPNGVEVAREVGRAAKVFALAAAVGELAASAGIVPWPAGEAATGIARCFAAWLESRGGAGSFDDQTGIRAVRFFVGKNAALFQTEQQHRDGIIPRDRAGFRVPGFFLILGETFRDEVCKGMDAVAVAKALHQAGYLEKGAGKNYAKKFRGKGRCYAVLESIISGSDDPGPDDEPEVSEREPQKERLGF